MTDLQDRILDRLVGTWVGVDWPDGPLAIAADVVGGPKPVKFGQTDNDRGPKAEIACRLGYPVLLCEAIQGANRGLKAEDDRRSLAIALFGAIPIGEPMPKLSSQAQNRIALRLAMRAHPFVCQRSDCAVLLVLANLLQMEEITRAQAAEASRTWCETGGGTLRRTAAGWLTASSTPVQRVVQSAALAIRGFESGKSVHGWCSIRESARLAASERGPAEAVSCCIDIARLCGMKPAEGEVRP
jgi:hypothetical protein